MMTIACPFCGANHWNAEKVANSPPHRPEFTACCQRGHIDVPYQSQPPDTLSTLLDSNNDDARHFRENIQQYNMALAFMSLGITEEKNVNRQGGWVFRVQGELCHLIGLLHPDEDKPPSYAQLYIYDSHMALAQRMNRNNNLSKNLMDSLQSMLIDFHQYATEFKHAYEVLEQYPDESDASIWLRIMPGQDQRHYNVPTSDEVDAILPGDGTAPERHNIIPRPRSQGNSLSRINDGHPAYSPLHYVLLFPNGDNGWHRELYHHPVPGTVPSPAWKPPRVSQTQYSLFHLHMHNTEYLTIHRGG